MRTLIVALIPLIVLSAAVFVGLDRLDQSATEQVDETRQLLSDESVAVTSQDQAISVAREINLTLLERVTDVTDWATNPQVVEGAQLAETFARDEGLTTLSIDELEARFDRTKTTGVALEAQNLLRDSVKTKPAFREVFFTDSNGYNAGLTRQTSDFVQSDEEWWQEAWTRGFSIGDVEFDDSSGVYSVDIAVRIDEPLLARRLGVMKAVLSISFVQAIAEARATENVDYLVALNDGRLVADTVAEVPGTRIMDENLAPEDVSAGLVAALEAATTGAEIGEESVFGFTRTTDDVYFDESLDGFTGFDWVVVSSQPSDVAFAPLRGLEGLTREIEGSGRDLRILVVVVMLLSLAIAWLIARLLSRGIVGPIQKLTTAISGAATVGLPAAVASIDSGEADLESVELAQVTVNTDDELEQLADSFNSVQGTAVRLASEQAIDRRKTSDMFVNLGRRNQSLIKRQLRFIDSLERTEADPDTLDALFKLDHLATRMRRNAESLLVLAGERSPRRWAAPVPMLDVVQAALAEVEGYERVDMRRVSDGQVQGSVVADVAHILAELIENALNFSPPQSTVTVAGRQLESGYQLQVIDEGLGLPPDDLADVNRRLSESYELAQVPAQYLGLFVVGRLARHHGIDVTLSKSDTGGLTATIMLSTALTTDAQSIDEAEDGELSDEVVEIEKAEAEARAMLAEAEEALAKIEAARQATADEGQIAQSEAARQATADEGQIAQSEDVADTADTADAAAKSGEDGADEPSDGQTIDGRQGRSGRTASGEEYRIRSAAEREAAERNADPSDSTEVERNRRKTDAQEVSGTDIDEAEVEDDLEKWGLSPRRARSDDDADAASETAVDAGAGDRELKPSAVASGAASAGEEISEATAEENRSQWSAFQRGKESAESADVDVDEDDQGAKS